MGGRPSHPPSRFRYRVDRGDYPGLNRQEDHLTPDDIERLSGKVEKIYEKNETDFENLLADIQKMVTSTVRQVYKTKKH